MEIFLIILWILLTLAVVSFSGILAKRYGVEYLIALVPALMIIANVLATKIVMFGPITITAGVIAFSMTFLVTDLISEKWGKKYATRAVWIGFYANVILIICIYIAIAWEAAPFASELGEMFNNLLGLAPRIAFAGLIAYLVSQHHDVWAFNFWKKLTRGKHLWLRNNASTMTSQLLDSAIFGIIGFYGVIPIIPLIFGQWIVKLLIAALDTPFMYLVVSIMDRIKEKH